MGLSVDGVSGFLKVYRGFRWSCWIGEREGPGLSLAVVRDLREARVAAGPEELAALETDVFAGFVLARAAAGLADATIASDVVNLEQIRVWFGRPLWEMEPTDADAYFGKVLRCPQGHQAGTLAGAQGLFPVSGDPAQSRDPSDDRPGRRMPDR
jgi:hypothetical protein